MYWVLCIFKLLNTVLLQECLTSNGQTLYWGISKGGKGFFSSVIALNYTVLLYMYTYLIVYLSIYLHAHLVSPNTIHMYNIRTPLPTLYWVSVPVRTQLTYKLYNSISQLAACWACPKSQAYAHKPGSHESCQPFWCYSIIVNIICTTSRRI